MLVVVSITVFRVSERNTCPTPTRLPQLVLSLSSSALVVFYSKNVTGQTNAKHTPESDDLSFQVYEIFDDLLQRIQMNSLQVSEWFPSILIPFFTLSYPTSPPPDPDSFHDSFYYTTGILDACVIVSCIAVMAVLRDVIRVYLMEPFAKWKLTRDWQRSQRKKIQVDGTPNGSANGSPIQNGVAGHRKGKHVPLTIPKRDARRIHRSVLRFAEQGWAFIYYTINFAFGVVSDFY